MARNSVSEWSSTASDNTDVGGVNIAENCPPSGINNAIRTVMAQVKDYSTTAVPRGHLYGLTLSNGSDATNDIDIAVGECATDATAPTLLMLASALTKRLDAAWAVGTGNGGLDTGSIANTTYHLWLIQRSDTGVVDALFSASATAPTMPANYDRKRRIGAVLRISGAIMGFVQNGDEFAFSDGLGVLDMNGVNPATGAELRTLSVPIGISVVARFNSVLGNAGGQEVVVSYTDPAISAQAPSQTAAPLGNVGINITSTTASELRVRTNTSGQIRSMFSVSGVLLTYRLNTMGWTDTRGRI